MKVVLTTLMYKRYHIFEIWARQAQRIVENCAFDISVCVAGSDGSIGKELCKKYGFDYLELENKPLGKKANDRLQWVETLKPDYVVFLGSDDLMSVNTWKMYEAWMHSRVEQAHMMDIFYYDVISGTAYYSHGYLDHREGTPLAVGRMLSKKRLDKFGWKLWDDKTKGGLDADTKKVFSQKCDSREYRHSEKGSCVVALKGEQCLTPIAHRFNYDPLEPGFFRRHFNEDWFDWLWDEKGNKIHRTATVIGEIGSGNYIQAGARIGGEAHIRERPDLPKTVIGNKNWIGENTIIKQHATIGDDNMIMGLVNIGHHCIIGDKNEIGTGSIVCGHVTIGDRNKIKVHTSIRNRVRIGDDTLVGMGANVTKNVTNGQKVKGNPAKEYE